MRIASLLTFTAGLVVAGGSAYLAQNFFEAKLQREAAAEKAGLVEVLAAAQSIPFGQTIESQKLTTIAWPKEALPPGVFTDTAALLPTQGQQPRRAKAEIAQGELILASKVSGYGEKITIVQTLGPNSRAMAIEVNASSGVGGFVTPGDKVDVMMTRGRNDTLKTVTILQDVRVIGVDQTSDEKVKTPGVARTVTVEVTPEQGQRLALAQKAGTLSLTLRTLDDAESEPLPSIGLADILSERPSKLEPTQVRTVIIRRGTEVTETAIK
ncbi:MAG: Flp pilus assembly protein CpaB [Thioclava marina]|uniref:Flp pilus assembly protein CpaB n=1 Tax=Thioclava marina TaxID=1915077 RepID=UPI0019AFC049|nr:MULTISPECIES: Flp pilus assembly protein CpaB [Thioclava]MBC7144582.1 Flp pilus assembly protein CpaB [Thioclava marina]MBD3802356.1 Flp pilus assembly protein CpaB [Thioclava sp.]